MKRILGVLLSGLLIGALAAHAKLRRAAKTDARKTAEAIRQPPPAKDARHRQAQTSGRQLQADEGASTGAEKKQK